MLQCPFISTIVFKDLDWKLGHTATTNNTFTQVTLSLMDVAFVTTRPVRIFPSCLSFHIHSKYMMATYRVPHIVQTTVKKHSFWFFKCHLRHLAPFRFLKDLCCSFRWVHVQTHALATTILQIFNHIEVRGGCRIKPQSSLTNRMDAWRQYLQLLGCRITEDIAVSISPKAPA
jgi:hypothetical protein